MRTTPPTVLRNPPRRTALIPILAAILASGMATFRASAGPPEPVDFSRDVLPILSNNCFLCHGPDATDRKANLRLDLKDGALRKEEPVIVAGRSGESELFLRVSSGDPEETMPPPKSGRKLTRAQVDVLKRWIDEGARWGRHWAFEPPHRPDPPEVRDTAWARVPIDRFVLARLDAEGLKPSPEAGKATLIRRVTLDLTGLPPSPAEVDAFLADCAADAYEKVVDRLLASPRYGERMAMDWLDQARFADTNGYQNDFARTMWPWRDWVIAAFNRNQPYDAFVVDQVAGDLLPGATLAQKVATGFNRNNRTVTEAGSIEEEWRVENAVDRVETTATVFLGLTMGCARCHDHKFDPITQREFYGFFGFFNSLNEKGVYTETRGNVPPLVAVPGPDDGERLRRLAAAIAEAEKVVRAEESKVTGLQREWERERQKGAEPVEPADWSLRIKLDGGLRVEARDGVSLTAAYRGPGAASWADGPSGKALRIDGKEASFVDTGISLDVDRTDRLSYGGWVRPRGSGAVLSLMDDAAAFRGFDLLIENGKVVAHLVHAWPGDAIKVATREGLPADAWSHVLVTYDGSGKAAGLKVYIDGRAATLDVSSDTLRGTTVTAQPFRLGRRLTNLSLNGDLADVRVYRRTIAADEARDLADGASSRIARMPAEGRSKVQQDLLAKTFRDRFAPGLREASDRLAGLRKEKTEVEGRIPTVMVLEDLPHPRETYVLKRGQYQLPDKTQKVEPGVPACLPALPSGASRNRLGLARWLVAPENPLTARVAVNWIWQHHFGTGLVKTSENLGLQGELPSHPALLDWLATDFVASGWDMKGMHRKIVTSATYRQSSKADPALAGRDPENRLLARGPRFRLAAEAVRDNALAIGGLLVEKIGGPSVKPYQPAGLWEELAGGAGEGSYVQEKGPGLYRRSLYVYRKRTVPYPGMTTFDAPSREVCQVRRPRTNTPLQALELLNDVTYVEAARGLAQLMMAEGGKTPEDRITFAFRRAIARGPSEAELRVVRRGLERYRELYKADRAAAERFVRHGESPLKPGLDVGELAAYTAAAGVILNLDETITLE